MTVELRTATADDWPAIVRADERSFNADMGDERVAEIPALLDAGRFVLAVEEGGVVGVAGSLAFTMAVPGGSPVPVSGVTWVSVLPTHRRQGILTRLMAELHRAARERGEVAAALTASEGGIYGRFGYGPATWLQRTEITRSMVRFRDDAPVAGTVRFTDGDEAAAVLPELFETCRRDTPGEVDRAPAWWRRWFADPAHLRGDLSRQRVLLHRDGQGTPQGWCSYRAGGDHDEGLDLQLTGMYARTREAHAALWRTVLSVDLVRTVRSWRMPGDDPLPFLLQDPRAVKTADRGDHQWLCPLDPHAVLTARTYDHGGTPAAHGGEVVLEVPGHGRWSLDRDGARRTTSSPGCTLGASELGAIVLGGTSPVTLWRAGRVDEQDAGAVQRLAVLMRGPREPLLTTPY